MGDFLILRHDLDDDPHVRQLCALLGRDPDFAISKLRKLWVHADRHTEDGLIVFGTHQSVDGLVGCQGFAKALCLVGWLDVTLQGARVMRFEEWLGAEGIRRMFRTWEKLHPTGYKRPDDHPGFEDFWKDYPRKKAKKDARRAWNSLQPDEDLQREILRRVQEHRESLQWTKERGKFIPYPATFLRGERWTDSVEVCDGPGTGVGQPGRVRAPAGKYARFSAPDAPLQAEAEKPAEPLLFPEEPSGGGVDPAGAPGSSPGPGHG